MSKLDELIQELCPDGVKSRTLEDCCIILDSKRKPITKAKRVAGEFPYYGANGVQDYVNDYLFEGKFVLVGEDGSVLTTSGKPVVNWAEGKIWVNNHAHIISEKPGVNLRYLFYYLQTVNIADLVHGNIPKLTGKDFKAIKTPIPPMEVQEEIVRFLDEFTAKTAELQAELNKEYEARKKQYEYYRDNLLNNNAEIPKIKLGEFAVISRGGNFQKKDFVDNGLPCIHYGQIYTHYGTYADTTLTTINEEAYSKSKKAKKNDIVMAVTSENIEDVCKSVAWLGDKDIAVSGHTAIISHHQNAKYLSYYFSSNAFFKQKKKLAHGTKVIEVTPNTLANIEVPLPSLEVQNRLVEVLDNFDSICSDLNIDLPAEIETRQKQYEYYRDSLLTFAETGHIMPQTDRQTSNN